MSGTKFSQNGRDQFNSANQIEFIHFTLYLMDFRIYVKKRPFFDQFARWRSGMILALVWVLEDRDRKPCRGESAQFYIFLVWKNSFAPEKITCSNF